MDISVIICSTRHRTDTKMVRNIDDTIGTSYEIVHIDNSSGQYGLCAAYNKGVKEAKGDILCFVHEDVKFHSSGWGARAKAYFNEPTLGMLGVAGCPIVPERGDWRFINKKYHVVRLMQGFTSPRGQYCAVPMSWQPTSRLLRVAILDGVWFCIRKETFRSVSFDDKTFPHFHLYDSDMSMQINALGLNVCVCEDIVIEHFSEGTITQDFCDGVDAFIGKWKNALPLIKGDCRDATPENLRRQADMSVVQLRARLEEDDALLSYRKRMAQGDTQSLPPAIQENIVNQEYGYVKKLIKNPVSMKLAWNALMAFPTAYRGRKLKLLWKFVYYRLLIPVFKKRL